MLKFLLPALILLFLFLSVTLCYRLNITWTLDNAVSNGIVKHRQIRYTRLMRLLSWVGGIQGNLILGCFALFMPFFRLHFLRPVLVITLISALLNLILKDIFDRDRPIHLFLIHENGFSYPSGHSMVNATLYSQITLLSFIYLNADIALKIMIVAILMILLIGFSRIYLGVHYLTDVIGGWALGLSLSFFFTWVIQNPFLHALLYF